MKIKKGDTVVVIAGKDKGAKGKVIQAYPATRPGPGRGREPDQEAHPDQPEPARRAAGGIVTQEASIHVSNVMVVGSDGKPTRVGKKITDDGKRVRISRRTGKEI